MIVERGKGADSLDGWMDFEMGVQVLEGCLDVS